MTNLPGFVDLFASLSIYCGLVLLPIVFFGTFPYKTLPNVSLASINGLYTYILNLPAQLTKYFSKRGRESVDTKEGDQTALVLSGQRLASGGSAMLV